MFACTLAGTPERPVLKLSGSLTLEHAGEIREAFSARLAEPGPFSVDMRDAQKFDLSFIQLLYSLLKDTTHSIGFFPLPPELVGFAASLGADSLIKDITTRTEEHV